jgi:hypothetical protein
MGSRVLGSSTPSTQLAGALKLHGIFNDGNATTGASHAVVDRTCNQGKLTSSDEPHPT